jgi:NADH-quinone oxidoreductase subunit A
VLFDFGSALVITVAAFTLVPLTLGVGALFRPSHPYKHKLSTYECGEVPVGSSWARFNVRFYMVAVVFLIFDVETLFMFPIMILFREWVANGQGLAIIFETALFILVLLVGLAYIWRKGDLEWIRTFRKKVGR